MGPGEVPLEAINEKNSDTGVLRVPHAATSTSYSRWLNEPEPNIPAKFVVCATATSILQRHAWSAGPSASSSRGASSIIVLTVRARAEDAKYFEGHSPAGARARAPGEGPRFLYLYLCE